MEAPALTPKVAAQCAIDAALNVVSRRVLGTPQTYREAFAVLARAGIIDGALRDAMQQWAGMRNVLVHMDTSLDLDKVHAAIGNTAQLRSFHVVMARELASGA
ncbi:MAG: DUF86 domain-containing protein [Planctomycetes bacterium]|nr:DUF86 domain-containing protein [Planctomycetota bacterium]